MDLSNQVSDYLVLAARTTPRKEVAEKTRGISLFLVDIERGIEEDAIICEEIEKTVSGVVQSYSVEYDDLRIPVSHRIGETGGRFYYALDGLNEERLVIAAEAIGLGELALEKGVAYANEREVFGRLDRIKRSSTRLQKRLLVFRPRSRLHSMRQVEQTMHNQSSVHEQTPRNISQRRLRSMRPMRLSKHTAAGGSPVRTT